VGTQEAPEIFSKERAAAGSHPEGIPMPVTLDSLAYDATFSHTALVGQLFVLEKKDAPVHSKPVHYQVEAVDAERRRRVLEEGDLAPANVLWADDAELRKKAEDDLRASFGDAYVKANFEPNAYGALRFRVPFAKICKQVTGQEVHALVLTLADDRRSGDIAFSDMVNVCGGQEDGEGTTLEQSWGFKVAAEPAAPAPTSKPAKNGRSKGKKGKKRGKKRR